MIEGPCTGGPLNGHRAFSRFPKGFLLVDKPAGACWLYDWDGAQFVARTEQPQPALDGPADGPGDSRYRAAAEPYFDVVAAPWVGYEGGDRDGDAGV